VHTGLPVLEAPGAQTSFMPAGHGLEKVGRVCFPPYSLLLIQLSPDWPHPSLEVRTIQASP